MKKTLFVGAAALFFVNFAVANSAFPVATQVASSQICTPNPILPSDTVGNFCTLFPATVASCWPPVGAYKKFSHQQMMQNYNLMKSVYGTLAQACRKNAATTGSTVQQCIDQWTCYVTGGRDSQGGLCSGTGAAC